MKAVMLVLLALCAGGCLPGGPKAEAREPEVLRQEISIVLAPAQHRLTGKCSVTFAAGAGRVVLRLAPAATVDAVSLAGKPAAYRFEDGVLSLELPGQEAWQQVQVSWRASFNDPVASRAGAGEDPSYGVNAAITAQGTFLGDGAYWYPAPGRPPAQRSLQVSAPAGTEAVSFGRRISRETRDGVTRSRWEEAHPVGVLSVCAGPYQVEDRTVQGIELHSYLYPDNAGLAARYLDAAARYLAFYSDLFGPYPFEKFAVVENFFQTGYGFPSFTLIGGAVLKLPFIVDTSFPHEIAHSWWGNAVGVDYREGNWCEGLVTYLADYLLKERRSPAEARDYRRQLLIDYASLVPAAGDFPLREFQSRSDPASRAIGYGKSAMVFHMVRTLLGEERFMAALRQVAREHLYGSASWSDLVRAFSKVYGQDLTPYLEQWLARPGGPRLVLEAAQATPDAKGWAVSGTVVQQAPLYLLDLPITLETAAGTASTKVSVSRERTRFMIDVASPPKRLLLDPEANLFRVLDPQELPATVNSIKGSTRLLAVRSDSCRCSKESFADLLASLSQPGTRIIPEAELKDSDPREHDLLFCGTPKGPGMLPRIPDSVQLGRDGFSVDGKGYPAPDGLLFLVGKQPGNATRVSALFEPLSEDAASRYAAKITHYGKFGELVFAAGANRVKSLPQSSEGGAALPVTLRKAQ
jgi:hypothetical protein